MSDYDDIDEIYKRSRIRAKQESAHREAQQKWQNSRTAEHLTADIVETLNLDDLPDFHALAGRLSRQAMTLDGVFFSKLHESGLSERARLADEPLKAAFSAQKQCRQVFDSLKSLNSGNSRNQTIDPPKGNE